MKNKRIGIIGIGTMGRGIAENLLKAGYRLTGYDLHPQAMARFAEHGGERADSAESVMASCEVVLVCLEAKAAIRLADAVVIPHARTGQVVIDHSTLPCPQTRRIGSALTDKGCGFLDAPTSGGGDAADKGCLRIFVGGDKALAERCMELFHVTGDPGKVTYCGPPGSGQAAKVVQQLTHRFTDVARMEVIAFGVHAGLDIDTVIRALGVDPKGADPYADICRRIQNGDTGDLSALFSEWAYYMEEVREKGFRLPMFEAMYEFCKDAPMAGADNQNRPMPSIWQELMKAGPGSVHREGRTANERE